MQNTITFEFFRIIGILFQYKYVPTTYMRHTYTKKIICCLKLKFNWMSYVLEMTPFQINKQVNIFFLHLTLGNLHERQLWNLISKPFNPKGWIDIEIELIASSPLYSPRHGKAQTLKTGFKGNRTEQGWRGHKTSNRNRHPIRILVHSGHFAVSSTLTSGHFLGMLRLRPIQQVHLRGLLRRNMAPGPALVPKVVQWRGILQLTGEVKAALQTCKEQPVVSGANCLPDVTFQPHSSTPGSWPPSHPQPSPYPGVRSYKFHRQLSSICMRRRLRGKNSVLCITQITRDVFRKGK